MDAVVGSWFACVTSFLQLSMRLSVLSFSLYPRSRKQEQTDGQNWNLFRVMRDSLRRLCVCKLSVYYIMCVCLCSMSSINV